MKMKTGSSKCTHIARPCEKAIAGFEEVKPMVFAGVYPIEAEDYENLRASLEKLQLNDASLTFQPESSLALGFGFRCGFLGLLHMEIVQERLDREFDMNVITTVPNVSYMVYDKQGHANEVHNPGGMPDPTLIDHIEEPFIDATIITATDYIGPIMTLCLGKRGELVRQNYVSGNRVEIHYKMPLGEIVIDFYDKLKSISKGYASFDYHQSGFRPSKLVKLDILLGSEQPWGKASANVPSATQFTVACDIRDQKVYYRTMYNSNIRCIDLKTINFDNVKYQADPLDETKEQPVEMKVIK